MRDRLLRTLLRVAMLAAAVLLGAAAVLAQRSYDAPIEVYVMRTPPEASAGLSRVIFIDSVTGETVSADVEGGRFTIVGGYVLYQQPNGTLFRLWPDGRTELHPFIQPAPETQQIDWVVSPDQNWIAWTLANRAGGGQVVTITTLARADGTEPRVLLMDGPDAFMRIRPLALTDDGIFFFDRQPQGVGDYFFYSQYAAVHRLDPGSSEPRLLPFEPNCFCGAGLSADGRYFARLERVSETGGYDMRVWNLEAGLDSFAPSIPAPYEIAGAVLVAPDGSRVVYSLANNLTLDSAGSGRERFMLALVDVAAEEQRPLLFNPLLVPLLPMGWTDGGGSVLLYNPRQDGTWKLILETGEIRQVSGGTRIGMIR